MKSGRTKNILWSLPLITVYLYVATVLTTMGYFEYYGVPSYFVGASIEANITYFFSLFNITIALISAVGWWVCAGLIVGAFVALYFIPRKLHGWIYAVGVGLFLWMLLHSNVFGGWIAKYNSAFLVPSANCSAFATSTLYLGIGTSEGKEIFIPVDLTTHKQLGGFMLKDLSETPCVFEDRSLWEIKK